MSPLNPLVLVFTALALSSLADERLKSLYPSKFPFLALFITKDTKKVVCSGTIIGRKFIVTTKTPITNYSVSDVVMLTKHTIIARNISQMPQYEIEEFILRPGHDIVVVKLTNKITIDFEVSPAFIDNILFRGHVYSCQMVVWTPIVYKNTPIGQKLTADLYRKTITNLTYQANNTINCTMKSSSLGCVRADEDLTIYGLNLGAPIMCSLGVLGIYQGYDRKSSLTDILVNVLAHIPKLRHTIDDKLQEKKEIICDPSGVAQVKSLPILHCIVVVFGFVVKHLMYFN